MASDINYSQIYNKAQEAYSEGNYTEAARIVDEIIHEYPEDCSALLLKGHIHCYGLQEYEIAKQQYQLVLELTEKEEFRERAQEGLECIQDSYISSYQESHQFEPNLRGNGNHNEPYDSGEENFDRQTTEHNLLSNHQKNRSKANLEQTDIEQTIFEQAFSSEDESGANYSSASASWHETNNYRVPVAGEDYPEIEYNWQDMEEATSNLTPTELNSDLEEETLFIPDQDVASGASEIEENLYGDYSSELDPIDDQNNLDIDRQAEVDLDSEEIYDSQIDNSEIDLDVDLPEGYEEDSQELKDIVGKISENSFSESDDIFEPGVDSEDQTINYDENTIGNLSRSEIRKDPKESFTTAYSSGIGDSSMKLKAEENFGPITFFVNSKIRTKQLLHSSIVGIVCAIAVLATGIITSPSKAPQAENETTETVEVQPTRFFPLTKSGALITLIAGISGFASTYVVGEVLTREVKKYQRNLADQFDNIRQGNLKVKASIYSEDELGEIASEFNKMISIINTNVAEAQRRAEETERDREDLQRQVIRLLDDVEGAARGDLTVKAQVTADVLGAVADAFNLTIENLREIVRQVKQASEQVHQGSTDSEAFARNQSSDALRMAEELAVTLNSVQMLTESIQRVAESAREAEAVARSSSVTALKGGEAVQTTLNGILQIRETVSETTRKVKRLAEASQEISKIVALITTISSRTNLLALNASIQAAKAGEGGRGFAIVADEVRQLADRSARSLRDIEQIVLQIQSETGSVMTAMEEGLQQVFDVTEKADQAKVALEDIIQVSNRIDSLVRSISADTVEQRENSRSVAEVMQSVELTAQETSQESHRVAGSLQKLVTIANQLLSSVERFRVDS